MKLRAGLMAGGVAVALGAASLGIWNSSWLKLQTVQVTGNHRTTTQEVQAAAALTPGMRLTAVSAARVGARVGALPWVASVSVTHVLPSRVRIAIRERSPAVIVALGARSWWVDHSGVVLQEGATGYPVVTGLPLTITFPGDHLTLPAFSGALAVLDALPAALLPRLSSVNASATDLLSVTLTDKTTITYGTADQLTDKNYDITTLLATGKSYASIDVQSPTHPAAVPR